MLTTSLVYLFLFILTGSLLITAIVKWFSTDPGEVSLPDGVHITRLMDGGIRIRLRDEASSVRVTRLKGGENIEIRPIDRSSRVEADG